MTITKAEAAFLGRQSERPVKATGELLAIWVSGKLVNAMNRERAWKAQAKYRREWRERVSLALLEAGWSTTKARGAEVPKRVSFLAYLFNAMDSDGLSSALKPVRDELVSCRVIHGDAERDGHEFVYEQRIDRARRGVEIRVALRGGG